MRILGIYRCEAAEESPRPVHRVEAVIGRGLRGDRYFSGVGTWSRPGLWNPVTMIASETLNRLRQQGFPVDDGDLRRNLITKGVDLREWIGSRIRIGSVVLDGIRLCEPCSILERSLDLPGLKDAIGTEGGLRCDIVEAGWIAVGDSAVAVREPMN